MTGSDPRVYGMADEDNRQTPAPEGFRGERGATADDSALRHDIAAGATPIAVQESSGVAFAEASGAPGPVRTQDAASKDDEAVERAS